ncbi:receptor-like protein 12 [Pyrus ussuriensis x Pyrus communis]|uniref:Receptor-like protein 12 n=1 Tax=Pyrus ussuriensis x Pyrus communis TaxID=2448454 RepID=A0A5N5H3C6_9ROSA|nr:receptor-like protein 12 [Pyrus ussuriensis x Pyrus communis]
MKESSLVMKPVIPLFPLLEEKGNKGKNKEGSRISQPVFEEILEAELPDPLFSLNSRGQSGQERTKDWIQDLIVKGKLLLEKPQANIIVDTDHFPEINMINLTWAEKWKGKATWEVKAERRQVNRPTKRAINKCQCECELEVPAARAIIDQELIRRREKERLEACISIMRTAEKETSRNLFQRLEIDSQPNGLSEVFRNYETS